MSAPDVLFVGAGPGDPGLLTVRALTALQTADIVLYDALVSRRVLACARRGAHCFSVGKRAGRHCIAQDEINRVLIALCRLGRRVVRLKGGDPAIFGRLTEEITALRMAGFSFEIIPGITAASAAAASAGLSLTCRGVARRVQFVTAHARAGEDLVHDWRSLADPHCTTVLYMVRGTVEAIVEKLRRHGLPPEFPALVVAGAARATESHARTTLSDLAGTIADMPASAPLIVILGNVVREASGMAPAIPRAIAAKSMP